MAKRQRQETPAHEEHAQDTPREIIQLLTRLGLRRDDPWVWLTTDGPVSATQARVRIGHGGTPQEFPIDQDQLLEWDGYSLDLIGIRHKHERMQLGRRQIWAEDLDLDVRYVFIHYQQSLLYVEYVVSDLEEEDVAIRGLLQEHKIADRKKAWAGRDLLYEALRRGTPEGPRKGSKTELWLACVAAIGELAARRKYYEQVPRGAGRYKWWDDNILRTTRRRKHRQKHPV